MASVLYICCFRIITLMPVCECFSFLFFFYIYCTVWYGTVSVNDRFCGIRIYGKRFSLYPAITLDMESA